MPTFSIIYAVIEILDLCFYMIYSIFMNGNKL